VVPAAGIVAEAMVMLTLARFVLEKVGGDTVTDAAANLATYRARIARPIDTPVVGARSGAAPGDGPLEARHGLTGSDEAGSGGDD
jgi:chorismate synthase